MAISEEKRKEVSQSYSRLLDLLREGESGSPDESGFQIYEELNPIDTVHFQRIENALDNFLSLTQTTSCYRDYVKQGITKLYGPAGLKPDFIMSLLCGVLEMKDKKREQLKIPDAPTAQHLRKLIVGAYISEREANTLGTTGRLNFDLENLTLEVFDPETVESIERHAYKKYGNNHPFPDKWKEENERRYRSS